jgi:hypothetical protein
MQKEILADLVKGQHPYATILSCSDSRVPPELIFDAGFGELFIVRVAGNVVSPEVAGSLQYAGRHLKTPLCRPQPQPGGPLLPRPRCMALGSPRGFKFRRLHSAWTDRSTSQPTLEAMLARSRPTCPLLRQILETPEGRERQTEDF